MFHFITNRKGGVGKTTLTVYLASAVALATEEPVLIVDTDPQNNAAMLMGFTEVQRRRGTLEEYMKLNRPVLEFILERDEFLGCHIIGSGHYDLLMVERPEWGIERFVTCLEEVAQLGYSHVFFDTPPAFTPIQQLCLQACETVLVPVQPGYLPVEGLNLLIQSIYRGLEGRQTPLHHLGVIINHRHPPSGLGEQLEQELRLGMSELVYKTSIPYSQWFERCAAEGSNLLERAKGHVPALNALHSLAQEFLQRVGAVNGTLAQINKM